jgi:alkyl sulfatase BDS1-like metallo-beta-lactamase superfamily hydrolase
MTEPLWRSRRDAFELLPATEVRRRKINDFIHLSEGLSNSYLIVTAEGRIIVNTGMGFETPVHKEYYDSISDLPVRYILLTQGHVDHVGGIDQLRQEGTQVIAQANIDTQQAYDERLGTFRASRSYFAFARPIEQAIDHAMRISGGTIPAQSKAEPTIAFEDRYGFELGGIEIELIAVSGAETEDSMLIWLPQHRICFTGNVFGALFGHFPNLITIRGDRYRDALRYVETLDVLIDLAPETLLVGHFDPVHGRDVIRGELERMRAAVLHVHDAVVAGMNAGTDVWTLMREVRLPPELEVGEGYGKIAWSVRAIWEYYAGWFHHRSTTELYGIPPTSVDADLVELAGGPSALAARAGEHLAAGRPVEALHLAEIGLRVDAEDRKCGEVCLRAHRSLLAASVNFWESRWLENRIAELERASSA